MIALSLAMVRIPAVSRTALVVSLFILAAKFASGELITSTWSGGAGTWSDPTKWILPGIPQTGNQVIIDNTSPTSLVTVDVATAHLNNMGVAATAKLDLMANLTSDEITSFGTITTGPGATLHVGNGGFVQEDTALNLVSSGGSLLDIGNYSQGGGSTLVNGSMVTPLFHVTGGSVNVGSGGSLTIGDGGYTQDLAVTTTVASGGTMSLAGAFSQGNGTTVIDGNLSTALFHVTGGSVTVGSGGSLSTGTGGYTQGTAGTTTIIQSGAMLSTLGGDFSQEINTETVLDGFLDTNTVNNSGTLSGNGVIEGSFRDLGTVSPGDNASGIMSISGDYFQSGFLDLDIGGSNDSSLLKVGGTAVLGGTLDVALLGGFVPVSGETFLAMTYDSESGAYYNIIGSGLPGGDFWTATYSANALYLTFNTPQSGVPEPSTLPLSAGVLLSILIVRRKGLRTGK